MKAPGKAHREGISLMQLTEMFPDEDTAREWWESVVWPDGRHCPRCGSERTHECSHAKCPYRCTDCRSYFSAKTGTAIEGSKVSFRKWVFAIYLECSSLKGISSMKLHRDIGVSQKTAWFMLHRIREVWAADKADGFPGPVEVDETYVGGKFKNMHGDVRRERRQQPDLGKTIVVGAKDRATGRVHGQVIEDATAPTLTDYIRGKAAPDATIYTDEAKAYQSLPNHETVNHGRGEYVREDGVSTNGIESFWAMLKRGFVGTYHHWSAKHCNRYVAEFAGRHNMRDRDTVDQMSSVAAGMIGKRLTYKALIADDGMASGAAS